MRRLLLLLLLATTVGARASAQSEWNIGVRLTPDTLVGPHVRVRVMSLLDDPDWLDAITNSYPVRLEWTVQLWQRGLFGKAGPKVAWKDVVQRKSVMNIYELTTQFPGERATTQQFSSLDILKLYLGQPIEPDFGPRSPGNWYFRVTLKLSTLTADELDRLSASQQRNDPTGQVQRAFNKLMLKATLPTGEKSVDSPVFRWR